MTPNWDDRMALVVGDVMLDRYIYGNVSRVSPEAPIPVFRVEDESSMLGGASNVAHNIMALGGRATLVGVVGDDAAGREVSSLLEGTGIESRIVTDPDRSTTVKTRFVSRGQQLLRADRECEDSIRGCLAEAVLTAALDRLDSADVLILSDYRKGTLHPDLIRALLDAARQKGIPTAVDPKGDDLSRYRGASVMTPNLAEFCHAVRLQLEDDAEIAAAMTEYLGIWDVDALLVTRGARGATLADSHGIAHIRAAAREVFDVSGAGDTFIATLAIALSAGETLRSAGQIANTAAGLVVGKLGIAAPTQDRLIAVLEEDGRDAIPAEAAARIVRSWRVSGARIGLTNGCFDLLHSGHLYLLTRARAACDRLVVALNSDTSVRRLKGPTRPVQSAETRAHILSALKCVDLVVIFEEDTPINLIRTLRPDLLVKGADYGLQEVVGADLVRASGGEVLLVELVEGQSTSAIFDRVAR